MQRELDTSLTQYFIGPRNGTLAFMSNLGKQDLGSRHCLCEQQAKSKVEVLQEKMFKFKTKARGSINFKYHTFPSTLLSQIFRLLVAELKPCLKLSLLYQRTEGRES